MRHQARSRKVYGSVLGRTNLLASRRTRATPFVGAVATMWRVSMEWIPAVVQIPIGPGNSAPIRFKTVVIATEKCFSEGGAPTRISPPNTRATESFYERYELRRAQKLNSPYPNRKRAEPMRRPWPLRSESGTSSTHSYCATVSPKRRQPS